MKDNFRRERTGDAPFLERLIKDVVLEELGASTWPEPMRSHLGGIQWAARRNSVRERFPAGESRILVAGGKDAGWLYAAFLDDSVWLVEIMVAREYRGQGVARNAILGLAGAAGERPVRLKVNVTNARAIRLYKSLGFRRTGGDEIQHLMELSGGR